jgi:hypothetical protein
MTQKVTTARVSPDVVSGELRNVQEKLADAQVKVSQLEVKAGDLAAAQQQAAGAEQARRLGKEWAQAVHDLSVANGERQAAEREMNWLLRQQGQGPEPVIALAGQVTPKIATTAPPDPFLNPAQITTVAVSGMALMLPLVLVLARRLWVRGPRREQFDPENSPRMQRMEQAIESIALEVERIGEAQRFTTKLFADRAPDAVARMSALPRKEPGTITPH